MKCRGRQVREQIVEQYQVIPKAHIKLLAGQTKRSDAEADITDEYYIFEAISFNGKKETIQCGMGAARHFLELLNHDGLPIFNPLHTDRKAGGHDGINLDLGGKANQRRNWNQTARQLYNAIMWLIIAWNASPNTPLFEFRDDVIQYHNCEPFDWKVKRVNTVIKNGGRGKTLSEIINDFRNENNIRNDMCRFDLLNNVINNMTDKNGNPLNIQSFFG